MTETSGYGAKFQRLLRELFQFDCADLDFGIYRIMNEKREVIEKFIAEDLPGIVTTELDRGSLAAQARAAEQLEKLIKSIRENFGYDALDGDNRLDPRYRDLPVGRRYENLQALAAGGRGRKALEADLYNHLYAFFSRYYQDGDFISKRRYSRRERYAIPYNGEEVHFHWANRDQYYVKTAEHFRNYAFVSQGVTVRFQLRSADVEQNNIKGEKRFFLPRTADIDWDEEQDQLVIPFEHRPLTKKEKRVYGGNGQQDAIIAETLAETARRLEKVTRALAGLTAERRLDGNGDSVTFLEHHLRRYVRRNTSDFFIHKNLQGFLSRELDFYLKNEVLHLDEMEAAGEDRAEVWFQMMRTIKEVGGRIVDFLNQIESFQKILWEKRKFVTETQYCIAVGCISETFYSEIAACEPQWQEWKELLHIDENEPGLMNAGKNKRDKRIACLRDHPTLMLDTRNFQPETRDSLVGSIEDLDATTDGLLIESENFQAVNLLLDKFKSRIKCIHLDPPYNTQTSGFLYKNDYKHSSWLSMMADRIIGGVPLLVSDGSFLCHIDENEYERLYHLFGHIGIPNAGTIIWDKRNPMMGGKGVASQHEYVIWRSATDKAINVRDIRIRMMLGRARELIERHGGVTEEARQDFTDWVSRNRALGGGEKAYRYLDEAGRIYRSASLSAPEPRADPKFFEPLMHPVTGKPCAVPPNGFSRTPETHRSMMDRGEIVFGSDESTQPQRKRYLGLNKQISSVIRDGKRGKADLDALGLENFPYCHPVSLYLELIGAAASESGDIVLDYFAGSGTTGHAVIDLNREDGGRRKFILVEMGHHFDTVMLPRIKKATFAPGWKDGKPRRLSTPEESGRSPRIVKYMRLESYEDALSNIEFDAAAGQAALRFDDYVIKYMLKWEAKHSDTMLNLVKLARPFRYKLPIHANGRTGEKIADIPETFNYLLGLEVQTRRVYDDDGRRYLVYRGRLGRQRVAVIWRDIESWNVDDFGRDKQFVIEQQLAEGADTIFVNGDSVIHGAKSLDPVFKARMFASVKG